MTYEAGYNTGYADAVKDVRKLAQSEWEETTGVWHKEEGDYTLTVEMADPSIHQEMIQEPYDEDNYAWFVLGGRLMDTILDAGWASSVDQGKSAAEEAAQAELNPPDKPDMSGFDAEGFDATDIALMLSETGMPEFDSVDGPDEESGPDRASFQITDRQGQVWSVQVERG